MSPPLPPGITATRAQNLARLGLLRSRRVSGNHTWMVATPGASSVLMTWGLESDFDIVRLVFHAGTTSYAVSNATIAPMASLNTAGFFAPLDGSGAAVTPTTVTFNAAGVDGLPPSASGSTAGVTVAAGTAALPSITFSDWMRVSSITNTDGTPIRLLQTRVYGSAVWQAWSNATLKNGYSNTAAVNRGRLLTARHKITGAASDTTTAGAFSSNDGNTIFSPQAVQYYSRSRGATVMTLGDSLTQGSFTTGDTNSFGHVSCCALSTASRPVEHVNAGYAGQTADEYYLRGRTEIDAFRPEVVVIETGTPNGGASTQAAFDAAFSKAVDLAHYCISLGIVPILKTSTPISYSAPKDLLRKIINARVLAMGASGGWLVLDADGATTDGGSPAQHRAEFLGSDSLHLNDAGHAAIAARFTPVLHRALG